MTDSGKWGAEGYRPQASIIIATCGSDEWRDLAASRALPSANRWGDQSGIAEIILHHGPNEKIHEARNAGAARARGEWLCFLDADDELEPGYIDAMLKGTGDLRYPRVRYVDNGQDPEKAPPVILQKKHLFAGNYMVIGTMLRKSLFDQVGGFDEFESWEDWALWIKCWLAGAQSELIHEAVYRVHRNPQGRCWQMADSTALHNHIVGAYRQQAKSLGLV